MGVGNQTQLLYKSTSPLPNHRATSPALKDYSFFSYLPLKPSLAHPHTTSQVSLLCVHTPPTLLSVYVSGFLQSLSSLGHRSHQTHLSQAPDRVWYRVALKKCSQSDAVYSNAKFQGVIFKYYWPGMGKYQGMPDVKDGFPEEAEENEEVHQARYVQKVLIRQQPCEEKPRSRTKYTQEPGGQVEWVRIDREDRSKKTKCYSRQRGNPKTSSSMQISAYPLTPESLVASALPLHQLPYGAEPYLWMAKSKARAATVFSPPDKLSIGRKRLPGATQLQLMPSKQGSSGFSGPRNAQGMTEGMRTWICAWAW